MHRLTVYLSKETMEIIEKMAKEEERSLTFIAEKLINRGIKESTRPRKRKGDAEQQD